MKKIINKSKLMLYIVLISVFDINIAFALVLSDPPTASEMFVDNMNKMLFAFLMAITLAIYFYFVLKSSYIKGKDKSRDVIKTEKRASFFLKIIIIISVMYYFVAIFNDQIAKIYEAIT